MSVATNLELQSVKHSVSPVQCPGKGEPKATFEIAPRRHIFIWSIFSFSVVVSFILADCPIVLLATQNSFPSEDFSSKFDFTYLPSPFMVIKTDYVALFWSDT